MFYVSTGMGLEQVWTGRLYDILTKHKGRYAYTTKLWRLRGFKKEIDNSRAYPQERLLLFSIQKAYDGKHH